MTISVYETQASFSREDLGNYLRGPSRKARLRESVRNSLRIGTASGLVDTPNLQHFADKYGEQITFDVDQDIAKFIRFRDLMFFTPGGEPIPYLPLDIPGRHLRPSVTAIGTIGEALAGWYLEQKGLKCVSRPILEAEDLIFQDDLRTITSLVSVKTTTGRDVREILVREAPNILQETLNVIEGDPASTFDCFLIGVSIKSQSAEYELRSSKIEVR